MGFLVPFAMIHVALDGASGRSFITHFAALLVEALVEPGVDPRAGCRGRRAHRLDHGSQRLRRQAAPVPRGAAEHPTPDPVPPAPARRAAADFEDRPRLAGPLPQPASGRGNRASSPPPAPPGAVGPARIPEITRDFLLRGVQRKGRPGRDAVRPPASCGCPASRSPATRASDAPASPSPRRLGRSVGALDRPTQRVRRRPSRRRFDRPPRGLPQTQLGGRVRPAAAAHARPSRREVRYTCLQGLG